MPITPEARAAQKREWVDRNRPRLNARRREQYHEYRKPIMSAKGKLDRGPCLVCGKHLRSAYIKKHIAVKHSAAAPDTCGECAPAAEGTEAA
jgi:DNA repair exonuclease SbcCD ATPase subunit